jgi:hypothetical protein
LPNYFISYIEPEKNNGHEDPMLQEFTFGDLKLNGEKLLGLSRGDYLFFHKTIYNKRYITAYYWVEEVHLVQSVLNDPLIMEKYHNHHLKKKPSQLDCNEAVVFGNPIRSKVLDVPLEITEDLLNNLSKKANLNPNQSPLAAMSSALRTWKELNEADVKLLLHLIKDNEKAGRLTKNILSTEEVFQVLERDIEKFIARNPEVLGEGYTLERQQHIFSDDSRLDLLLNDPTRNCKIVVEIKKGNIGREAKQQIKHYMKLCKEELGLTDVRGIIVCAGISPFFESELLDARKENIYVKNFGWKFDIND